MSHLLGSCGHGVSFNQPCRKCEIVSLRETIRNFEPLVEKAKRRLAILEEAKQAALQPYEKE